MMEGMSTQTTVRLPAPRPSRATRRPPATIRQQRRYDDSMTAKVRKTLTLDRGVVQFFSGAPGGLSSAINEALRHQMERRQREAELRRLVDDLDELYGPPEPVEIVRLEDLVEDGD